MSTSLLTTLKRYRTRRFAATMAAAAVLSGGVMASTAGTASAMPDCVGLRAYQLEAVKNASYAFGSYTTFVLEEDDFNAYEELRDYQEYLQDVSYWQGRLDEAGC
jgi:hypothetical protein